MRYFFVSRSLVVYLQRLSRIEGRQGGDHLLAQGPNTARGAAAASIAKTGIPEVVASMVTCPSVEAGSSSSF